MGTFNTVKATIPHLRKSHGAYLHVSATLHYQGTIYQAHVSAAKAGVDALSRVISVEEGPHGVRSNVIAPGGIEETEGWSRLLGDRPQELMPHIPLVRSGKINDIANATLFLFSDAANWISGQILVVDGGQPYNQYPVPYPQAVLDPESAKAKL